MTQFMHCSVDTKGEAHAEGTIWSRWIGPPIYHIDNSDVEAQRHYTVVNDDTQ